MESGAAAKRQRAGEFGVLEDGDERSREREILLHLLIGRPARVRAPLCNGVGRDHASTSMVALTRSFHLASRDETFSELLGSSGIILGLAARTTSASSAVSSPCPGVCAASAIEPGAST